MTYSEEELDQLEEDVAETGKTIKSLLKRTSRHRKDIRNAQDALDAVQETISSEQNAEA